MSTHIQIQLLRRHTSMERCYRICVLFFSSTFYRDLCQKRHLLQHGEHCQLGYVGSPGQEFVANKYKAGNIHRIYSALRSMLHPCLEPLYKEIEPRINSDKIYGINNPFRNNTASLRYSKVRS